MSAANSASVSPTPTMVGLEGTDSADDTRLRPPICGDQTTESSFDDDEDDDGEEEDKEQEDAVHCLEPEGPRASVAIVEQCQTFDGQPSKLGDGADRSIILLRDISPTVPMRTNACESARVDRRDDASSITFL
uniref:Uncharacterized protein n=1 Tax=Anopheles culicifacies TaxID=139723 RepID=A0A182M0Y0_9DIPT